MKVVSKELLFCLIITGRLRPGRLRKNSPSYQNYNELLTKQKLIDKYLYRTLHLTIVTTTTNYDLTN